MQQFFTFWTELFSFEYSQLIILLKVYVIGWVEERNPSNAKSA